jgi:hypothetical protein
MVSITQDTRIIDLTVGQFLSLFPQFPNPNTGQETKKDETPEVMGVDLASKFLGYKPSTVYIMTSKKILPHFKSRGKLLFRKSELLDFMLSNRVKTQSEVMSEMDQRFIASKGK